MLNRIIPPSSVLHLFYFRFHPGVQVCSSHAVRKQALFVCKSYTVAHPEGIQKGRLDPRPRPRFKYPMKMKKKRSQ